MKRCTFGIFGLVLGGMLLFGAEARAVDILYTTVGTFSGGDAPGTNVYSDAANGIEIQFGPDPVGFVRTPFGVTSNTSFGFFDTSNTTRPGGPEGDNFWPVSSDFTLDIIQFEPTFGTTEFVGTLSGQLHADASQAFIQFDQPLVDTIGFVIYEIVNADRNPMTGVFTPGRINLAAPGTNNGVTTINGLVTPIPEPSALVLVGLGAVAPLGLALRRRMKGRAAA